ncbi:MAG: flagellar basal body-associated FliL family protein [Candidatus Kryptonium sp.]|nr:flagellar basal body-associated FliL family protein [Candidatus Kryptonium sp.]MCX7762803.1 flagellar basal body-associated FliL family protein [Candidatus Kryptonium sp.]MDW8109240.1 flagellar basal body-associated FliL family protein [Candidatus Kryptonium sp.]
MTDKTLNQQQVTTAKNQAENVNKGSKKTILFVSIPIVILQIIIAYLLVLDLNSKTGAQNSNSNTQAKEKKQAVTEKKTTDEYKITESEFVPTHPEFLFVVKDLIVNPAGTGGMRYLLTSVGIEVTNEKAFAEIQSKEVIVNDILINVLSSKTLEELTDVTKRKELRREIATKVNDILTQGRVQNVYFSKFIVQ